MIISKRFNSVLFKDLALENDSIVLFKLFEGGISFILEDFVEVGLQYFYFEKYEFKPSDSFVIFNSVFMILKALELTYRMIMWMKEYWYDDDEWYDDDYEQEGSF